MNMLRNFKKCILAVVVFGAMPSLVYTLHAQETSTKTPKFIHYRVSVMQTKKAPLQLDKVSLTYKTRYRLLHQSVPNFAGHYAVTGVGCGAGCIFLLGVDLKTGKPTDFDLPMGEELIACDESYIDKQGEYIEKDLLYKPNSRLFVVTGRMPDLECGARYFEEKNGKMIHIMDIPLEKTK